MTNLQNVFSKVLKDPHKRAIYDTLGEKALNDEELYKVIKYDKTPEEIRANYERLREDKERQRLRDLLHPRSSITLSMDLKNLFKRPTRRTRTQPKVRFDSMDITAAMDLPFREQDKISLTSLVSSKKNVGHHVFTASIAHPLSENTRTELFLTVAERCALRGKVVRLQSKRDTITASAVFSPALLDFYSKEISYSRVLNKNLTFKTQIAHELTDEYTLTTSLAYEQEKYKLELKLSCGILVKNTYLSVSYIRSLEVNSTKLMVKLRAGLEDSIVEYGCETKLTKNSTVAASLKIGYLSGVSVELTGLVSNQMYTLNLRMHDQMAFAPIVYGSIGPVLVYACVKKFLVDPYEKTQKEQKERASGKNRTRKMYEKRMEAEQAIGLMQDAYRRSVQIEESSEDGLVIEMAIYGNADNLIEFVNSTVKNVPSQHLLLNNDELSSKQLTLVTVPLQCLVRDSILSLPEGRKVSSSFDRLF